MSDSITGLSSTNYSDVYDSKAGSLTNKLTDIDYSKASDDELMSVCKDFESYFVEQVEQVSAKRHFVHEHAHGIP